MAVTPNLQLRKPATTDNVNVETDLNENFDKIDTAVGNIRKLKYMDLEDTTPMNVNSASDRAISYTNFVGCAAQDDGVMPIPYKQNGIQYIKLVSFNDFTPVSGARTVRVWYV